MTLVTLTRRAGAALLAALLAAPSARSQALPPPASTLVPASPEVVIRFQGGDLPTNVARVLEVLTGAGFVATRGQQVGPKQNVCGVYQEQLNVDGCSAATIALAKKVNPRVRSFDRLKQGQEILVPDVSLRPYTYVLKFDRTAKDERQQMTQRAEAWSDRLVKRDVAPDGSSRLTFQGFELKVPVESDAKAQEVLGRLEGLRGPNVLTSATFTAPRDYKRYSLDAPGRFFDTCKQGPPPNGDEGDLRLLMGDVSAQCPRACTAEAENCPEIVLIDTPVESHPDLRTALLPMPADDTTADTAARECKVVPFEERKHHGTHLAGIIAAAQNGFGFVGVSPQSSIVSIARDTQDHVLADWISERDNKAGMPIYVFASNWDNNGPLTSDEQRFNRNAIARAVRDVGPLWIAAAGDESTELSALWHLGPQNMGDQRNVVLVSACGDCTPAAPSLIATANRSATMVHLAAPGKDVPSTVGVGQYAVASGTSQATAFVAGVASAMVACYPQRYAKPHQVKSRLQTTSRPFPAVDGGDTRRDLGIATGVLDAEMALLDPNQDWIKTVGQPRRAVRIKKWTDGEINLLQPVTRRPLKNSPVRTRDLQRLVLVPGPAATGPQWVAYSKVAFDDGGQHFGDVVRIGPGVLAGDQGTRGMVETCDGTTIPASQIEDILVSTTGKACP
jgi:hypothetical protein